MCCGRWGRDPEIADVPLEARRHDPDDRAGLAVEPHSLADDARFRAEPADPRPMTELGDTGRRRLAVLFGKRAARERRDAEEREHVRRDPHGAHALGAFVGHVVHASGFGSKDRLERRRLLLVVEELGARQRAAEDTRRRHVAQDDVHHPILVHVGERIEQDVADDAVDDGCRADTQRQRRDCEQRESGIPASDPEGLADVLPQRIEDGQPAPVAIALLGLIDATELHERDTLGLVFGHAATAVFFDVEREVRGQFLVEGALATGSSERIDEPQQERAQPIS